MSRLAGIRAIVRVGRGTFHEIVRQPAYAAVVVATLAACAASPMLSLFSLGEEVKLLKDFGVSSLFFSGLVIAGGAAAGVVRREIEDRTTLVLLAKPLSRPGFLSGKFLGVAAAILAALVLFTLALLLTARAVEGGGHGASPHAVAHGGASGADGPALAGGLGSACIAVLGALAFAWKRRGSFSGALLAGLLLALPLGFVLACIFDPDWDVQAFGAGFDLRLVPAAFLASCGVLVLAAFAVGTAVCLGRGATFIGMAGLFLAGLAAGSLRGAAGAMVVWVPDFQLFWAGDIFYGEGDGIDAALAGTAALYALAYVVFFLALGAWALERREL